MLVGGSLLKRLLYGARSLEQERERKLLNAYARGYKKYRRRQMERKRRKRERQPGAVLFHFGPPLRTP